MSEEIVEQIKAAALKLKELQAKLRIQSKFKHKCPYCKLEWDGWKEHIKECIFCHRRIDVGKPSIFAIPNIERCKVVCERFDEEIKKAGRIVKKSGFGEYIFEWNGSQMEYTQLVSGIQKDHKIINGSFDEIGTWPAWELLFKEEVQKSS